MGTRPNIVERAYIKLNSSTKLTVSTDELLGLLAVALAVAMPQITGIPWKYASPVTLFITLSALVLIKKRAAWRKHIVINATGCFVLYVILAVFGSRH